MWVHRLPYALGVVLLGLVSIAFRDFLLQWQPVPDGVPQRELLAIASGIVLVAGGLGLCFARTVRLAAIVLAIDFLLWVLVLKVPGVVAKPAVVVAWLGVAEILAIGIGAATLVLPRGTRALRVLFGLCALVFGLSHFVYADFTAQMVPAFMGLPLFWAYATGAGHAAAGLALIAGVLDRLAATLFTAMLACFVVLLHVPRVLGKPGDHAEWTMLGISLSLAGAAWLVRQTTSARATR